MLLHEETSMEYVSVLFVIRKTIKRGLTLSTPVTVLDYPLKTIPGKIVQTLGPESSLCKLHSRILKHVDSFSMGVMYRFGSKKEKCKLNFVILRTRGLQF